MSKNIFLGLLSLVVTFSAFSQARMVVPFNEGWSFKFGSHDYGNIREINYANQEWQSVTLPHTFNKDDMQQGTSYYTGDAFYRKIFSIGESDKGKNIFLRFEGVGAVADIYLNGQFLTEHKGAYSAFAFELTHLVHYGRQDTLTVKVNNSSRMDVVPINMSLFPVYGGIYRPVSLVLTAPVHFTVTDHASPGLYIQQQTAANLAQIAYLAKIENKEVHSQKVQIRTLIRDANGKIILSRQKTVALSPQGINEFRDTALLKNPHLWNGVTDPYLYAITSEIIAEGKVLDAVTQPLGLRKIELVAGKGVFLNGKKCPMYGVTRHQDWWGYGSALGNWQHRRDMELIREMGATTIRLAHYQQSEEIYSLADSLGLLVWAEIPFVNATSLEESENAHQQMRELVRQDMNHPSIYIWGMHNEVYSKNKDEHVPVLTRELNDICKTDDPGRPTVAVSGYGEIDRPSNLAGDVQGVNRYYGWYEGKITDLEQWARYLETDFPDYKVMLSEYGADANIDQHSDTLPAAENIDPIHGKFYPEEYQTETHIQQWAIIQKHPAILASYVWNMFEFAVPGWTRGGIPARNLKGPVTFDRQRKKDAFYWYKANWNPEPMLYLAERRDSMRIHQKTRIQLFSNLKDVEVWLNGKKIPVHQGVNDKHWICEPVLLENGRNHIEAKGKASSGKLLSDSMDWWL